MRENMLINNINNYIDENNITITDFAKKCGLKQSTISNIINGYTRSPTIEVVSKIANGMNMTIDEAVKNDKREIDEIKKIYEKMKELDDIEKEKIYAMMNSVIQATINLRS